MTVCNGTCNSLMFLLNRATRDIKLRILRNFKEAGYDITPEQWVVLSILSSKDGVCQQELGNLTLQDNAAVTRIIDNMEKRDLLKRAPDVNDRRMNLLYLSDNGKSVVSALADLVDKSIAEATIGITDNDLIITKEILNRISGNLK